MNTDTSLINQAELLLESKAIAAEAMGWLPLAQCVYLHRGAQPGTAQDMVIHVVGVADVDMVGGNVLWIV